MPGGASAPDRGDGIRVASRYPAIRPCASTAGFGGTTPRRPCGRRGPPEVAQAALVDAAPGIRPLSTRVLASTLPCRLETGAGSRSSGATGEPTLPQGRGDGRERGDQQRRPERPPRSRGVTSVRAVASARATASGAVPPMTARARSDASTLIASFTSSPMSGEKPRSASRRQRHPGWPRAGSAWQHHAPDDLVRLAEGQALAHEVIGEVGRGREVFAGGLRACGPCGR